MNPLFSAPGANERPSQTYPRYSCSLMTVLRLDGGHEETSEGEKSEMVVERRDQLSQLPADAQSSGESDSDEDMEVIQVEARERGWGRREQWDCESILRYVDVFGVCRHAAEYRNQT